MKTAVVVGTGAGGATIARELQGAFQVTMIDAGGAFAPFSMPQRTMEHVKRLRLLRSHRQVSLFFSPMRVTVASGGIRIVTGRCVGGTTTLGTGNAIRADESLRALGICLDEEFERLHRELPIGTAHRARWKQGTLEMWDAFSAEGLSPVPMPKIGHYDRCTSCGRCVLGCPRGAKWDSRRFVTDAQSKGSTLKTGWRVTRVEITGGEARGVWARRGTRARFFPADIVIVAAGGVGTPPILRRSGIQLTQRLFVDPVLCIAAPHQGIGLHEEVPMPFFAQCDGFMLSPYFDYMSYLFDPSWPATSGDIASIMIKLADTPEGSADGRVVKALDAIDRSRLEHAIEICSTILERMGHPRRSQFRGMITAGHPGGTVPLSESDATTLHPHYLPGNLFVADASLLPGPYGAPPILTIMAMALRVARHLAN